MLGGGRGSVYVAEGATVGVFLFFFNSPQQGPVLCLDNGLTNGLLFSAVISEARWSGAGGVTVSQCISSAGFGRLRQDLGYPL